MTTRKRTRTRRHPLRALIAWLGAGIPILGICALAAGMLGTSIGGYLHYSKGLPDIPDLRRYRPKTVSTFYAEDGTVIGIFYREKRFPIPLNSIPPHVVNAFLAAEDARFFSHVGVDWIGVGRALVENVRTLSFSQGGSTITQQLTRYFLLSNEKAISRKIREWILAYRLEKTLTKKEILQLYLNEIYLGKGAYGVEAAARNYFGKTTQELTVAEAALIAGLVPNPSKFAPHKNVDLSLSKRKLVLESMFRNGFISAEQCRSALADVPKFRENLPNTYQRAPYFAESVRQYIADKYGENRLYNEGLKVWTTCDLSMQKKASKALVKGVQSWEKRRRRPTGLVQRLKSSEVRAFLASPAGRAPAVGDVVGAVVLSNKTPKKRRRGKKKDSRPQECEMALKGGASFTIPLQSKIRYRTNDLLHFKVTQSDGTLLTVEPITLPPVQGAVVCIENHTGYVRALVGGTDFQRSRFNRAMQAKRQPGSAFKPFVYTAALEWGRYGPLTLVVDEPIAVEIDPTEEEWIPANSDGNFFGPINLRQALAHSRNIAAVKLIMDVGVDTTIRMARNMGIESKLGKNLSLCLGASEVTPLELTSAYTVLPNMGMRIQPVLVKKVIDRFGNVLEDNTMEPLNTDTAATQWTETFQPHAPGGIQGFPVPQSELGRQAQWGETRGYDPRQGGSAPTPIESVLSASFPVPTITTRPPMHRVLSPHSAYLITSMLREVCQSGTAAAVGRLGRKDLAGKTGTTDDCTDAWFVGFSPQYTTGVWIGYDTKISLGGKEYGNVAALPVWTDFMKEVLSSSRSEGYPVPPGIVFWGLDKPIQSARRDELLCAEPDVPPNYGAKPVCPVDDAVAPASFQVDPYSGRPIALPVQNVPMGGHPVFSGFGPQAHPGTLRVLSPRGETLGQAYYLPDEKGEMTLYRDDFQPYGPYQQVPMHDFAQSTVPPGWGQPATPWTPPQPPPVTQQPEPGGEAYGHPGHNPYSNSGGWR